MGLRLDRVRVKVTEQWQVRDQTDTTVALLTLTLTLIVTLTEITALTHYVSGDTVRWEWRVQAVPCGPPSRFHHVCQSQSACCSFSSLSVTLLGRKLDCSHRVQVYDDGGGLQPLRPSV